MFNNSVEFYILIQVFLRKLRKAEGKAENDRIDHLKEKRPKYKLDHIVKER